MKKLTSLLLVVLMMMTFMAASYAEDSTYYSERTGTVICTQLTVRSTPSTNGKSCGKLKNGQTCTIIGRTGDWYIIDLASCGFKNYPEGTGYAKASLIVEDPRWIVLTKYTVMYADPWSMQKSNGEQSSRVLQVISENEWLYCVQTRETTAGSSFILKSDVGQYSNPDEYNFVVVGGDAALYDDTLSEQIATLKTFDIVQFIVSRDNFYKVRFEDSVGWVKKTQLQRIIN